MAASGGYYVAVKNMSFSFKLVFYRFSSDVQIRALDLFLVHPAKEFSARFTENQTA